jgi:ATP-binding cassette subfamily B protein
MVTGNLSELISRIFTVAILWLGSYFAVKKELSPGELLSFYTLMGYFTSPALSLLGVNKYVQDALIAADRLFEIVDLDTEPFGEPSISAGSGISGDIQFHHVHFRYGTREFVLDDLNFIIHKNSITGIVGESGCGKSTIISLLQNLYVLQDGNIRIGELDIVHINRKSLRQLVSVVPQQIELFAGTIIENIALGEMEPELQRLLQIS